MNKDITIKKLETTINKLRIQKELIKNVDSKFHGVLGNAIGELKNILKDITSPEFNIDNDPVIKVYLEQKKIWRDY